MTTTPFRIDVHHHVFPPDLVAELGRRHIEWTGETGIPPWSVDAALQYMDRQGIAAAVASVQPQLFWGDKAQAAEWARPANEYLAGIVREHPTRYGGFASLPLPDTQAACRELEYALDDLGLDGVLLLTSVDGRYPGDPAFEELFQELNRRSAVVTLHPNTVPPGSDQPKLPYARSLVEFTFDTTRAVANLLFSGTLARYPAIRFILPHAGGAVPYLAWRLSLAETVTKYRDRVPEGTLHYLRKLYYETALSVSDPSLAALTALVPTEQILFGSDHPFVPPPLAISQLAALERSPLFDAGARQAIFRDNALTLFPRLAAARVESAV